MNQVEVGVIGVGFMGARWARAIAEHPAARLALVADVRDDACRALAERYGARTVRDPLQAAADPRLHGVVVCTPEHLHTEAALAAVESGKVVAVEKPLAHTVAACERIRDRARERGVPVLVGHVLRFEPRYALVHAAIEAGEIGAVQALRGERIGLVSDQDVLRGRTSLPLYYGVHELDVARWYAGDVARVHAERSEGVLRAHGHDLADLYSATLRFSGGAHGTLMLGWCLPARTPGFGLSGTTVIGESGVLRVVPGDAGVLRIGPDGTASMDVSWAPEVHGRLAGALAAEVAHFVDCVRGRAEPLCTAADGTEAVRASLALEASARAGTPVELAGTPPAGLPGSLQPSANLSNPRGKQQPS
jgi:predicted dehydrogenase